MIVSVSVVIIFYNFNGLVCLRSRTLLAMFYFIMNCDFVFSLGFIFTTFASCVWSEFLICPEVQLVCMSKQIGALSVWFYNLVYVYNLSMNVDGCSFGELLQIFKVWVPMGETRANC